LHERGGRDGLELLSRISPIGEKAHIRAVSLSVSSR
jgi:hypothetical protein